MKYTIDGLNRVTQADEGTYSGGSISNRTRQENWTLDQLGNWDVNKVDLNGDLDFTDGGGELNDDRTHNIVNELLKRDVDDNGSDDYTLVYDAVGHLTDDAQANEYIYDVYGRAVRVKNQSGTTIAEYKYNGLGHRISFLQDSRTVAITLAIGFVVWIAAKLHHKYKRLITETFIWSSPCRKMLPPAMEGLLAAGPRP